MMRFLQMSCDTRSASARTCSIRADDGNFRLNFATFDADGILTLKSKKNRHNATGGRRVRRGKGDGEACRAIGGQVTRHG